MFQALELVALSFFSLTVIYTVFNTFSGLFYKKKSPTSKGFSITSFCILIPAFKEDDVILDSVSNTFKQNYNSQQFDVVVIADQLKSETIKKLKKIGAKVIEVSFDKSTKAKSLNFALKQLDETERDAVVILDADNILEPNFLVKLDQEFISGSKVVQGKRVAKNMDTSMAILDSVSEIVNNHLFRKGPAALGLSASLIGSGMAFDLIEIKSALRSNKAVGGFDKVLQLQLIENGHTITYLDDALIFDEKVDNKENFQNQRRRWLASQYLYLFKFFPKSLKFLFNGNFDYFNIGVLHNLFLPRVLNLGILYLLMAISIITNLLVQEPVVFTYSWVTLALVYSLCIVIPLPRKLYSKDLFKAFFSLPSTFLSMALLMFRLKNADKKFIHTKHNKKGIDNSLYEIDNGV